MKKIISAIFLLILSFTMISCLGENQIEGISFTGLKNEYFVNETIDTSNVVVTVKYTVDKSANYTVGPDEVEFELPDMSTTGSKVVKVVYSVDGMTFTAEKNINVIERGETLERIEVNTGLSTSTYFVGDEIDLSSVTLKAYYNVEGITEQKVVDLVYADFSAGIGSYSTESVGNFSINITYGGKSVLINYSVIQNTIENFVILNSDSINDTYYVGDTIDTSSITAQLVYKNGYVVDLANSELTFTGVDTDTIGDKVIIISYNGVSETIEYHVDSYENKISSIEFVQTIEDKTYYEGDIIDISTITIKVNYKDGSDSIVVSAQDLEITKTTTGNKVTIKVIYEGYSKEIPVTIVPVELSSIVIVNSLPSTSYIVGDSIDLSVITAKVIYNNGAEKQLSAEELTMSEISTKNPGDQILDIRYTDNGKTVSCTITITISEPEYNYTIISVNKPLFVQTYETNIAQKNDKTSEFYLRENGYVVGNQNPFIFLPSITAIDSSNNPVTVTEYHSYSRLYLVEGSSQRLLSEEELPLHVEIDEYNSKYQFTAQAAGSEYILKVQPADNQGTENNVVSFQFKVIEGYNVYSTKDLIIMNNHADYTADWSKYMEDNEIEVSTYNVSTLVIHDTLMIQTSDFPTEFFYQEDSIADPNNINYTTDAIKGTLKDGYSLFARTLKEGEVFTIEGNYFTINADHIPLVSKYDWDGSNSQLFYFESEDTVTNSNVNIKNLGLFGNSNKSSEVKDFGGLISIKIHGNHGQINCQIDNVIIKSFVINQMTAYEKAETVFNYCKLYDSYSNLAFNWEQANTIYNHCYIAESGGPLLVGWYEYNADHPDAYLNVEYNNSEYHSQLYGTESWFVSSGYSQLFTDVTNLNGLFNYFGGRVGFVNTDGKGNKYVSIPLAVNYSTASGDKGYALLKASINGNTIINTVDDVDTITIISKINAISQASNSVVPLFFNSNGESAFYNGSYLVSTDYLDAFIGALLQGQTPEVPPVAATDPFFAGDANGNGHLALYYGGSVFVLDYNANTI